jgi:hypothetical protein
VTADVHPALCTYEVATSVRHDRLDDEVIAIDLESGAYFALDDVAADCWSMLAAGASVEAVIEATAGNFDVASETVRSDVERFVNELLRVRLLRPVDGAPKPVAPPRAATPMGQYQAPAIERFDDLEELLALDPIHEVDKAGWPATRAEK